MDNDRYDSQQLQHNPESIKLTRPIPFILIHLMCFAVLWVGVSPIAVVVCVITYALRVFALTAFFHRYFSHRTFKTNRFWQFLFAFIGSSAAQRGPLWWASHHRNHHAHSDQPSDAHSPVRQSWLYSHMLWFWKNKNFNIDYTRVKDWLRFPELRWLDRFSDLAPITLAVLLYAMGEWLARAYPSLATNGWQLLVWGFFISTVAVYHVTFAVNSFTHMFGKQRYQTGDNSRNHWLIALLTFGEGWHNNHHYYPVAAQQGFYWWEIDISYYLLRFLALCGVVSELKTVPNHKKIARQDVETASPRTWERS
ncbi:MAG: acyl-CoA desaturase [Gammaproteobacteria bacterium]